MNYHQLIVELLTKITNEQTLIHIYKFILRLYQHQAH